MITMGGNAEIELIDSMDPFSEGGFGRIWSGADERRGGVVHYAAKEELAGDRESFRRRKGRSPAELQLSF